MRMTNAISGASVVFALYGMHYSMVAISMKGFPIRLEVRILAAIYFVVAAVHIRIQT